MTAPDPQTVRDIACTTGLLIVEAVAEQHLVHVAMAKHGISAENPYAWSETYDRVLDELAAVLKPLTQPDKQPSVEQAAPARAAVEAAVEAATRFRDAWREHDANNMPLPGSAFTFATAADPGNAASLTEPQLTAVLAELERLGRVEQERAGAPDMRKLLMTAYRNGWADAIETAGHEAAKHSEQNAREFATKFLAELAAPRCTAEHRSFGPKVRCTLLLGHSEPAHQSFLGNDRLDWYERPRADLAARDERESGR